MTTFEEEVLSVTIRKKNPDGSDDNLPAFDNTALVALSTCPRYGMIRRVEKRRFPGGRALPLEVGKTLHDVFACVRLFDAFHYQGLQDLACLTGLNQFGKARWMELEPILLKDSDRRSDVTALAIEAIDTSGYYDDPSDRRRTIANMEECAIAYIDYWPFGEHMLWHSGDLLGVELPFDIVVEFHTANGTYSYRLIGRCDGLHVSPSLKVHQLHENKTASRLGDLWLDQYKLAHQVTGYCIGTSTHYDLQVNRALVFGTAVPLPRSYDYGGIVSHPFPRTEQHYHEWLKWFWTETRKYEKYKADPLLAEQYTHSCYRYFKNCSLLPLCDSLLEDQREMFADMEIDPWTPLADKSGD